MVLLLLLAVEFRRQLILNIADTFLYVVCAFSQTKQSHRHNKHSETESDTL